MLGTTKHIVRRILKIAKNDGPEALKDARWGRGSNKWKLPFTDEQIEWATGPQRLKEQVGLSLIARRDAFNKEFGTLVSLRRFRRLYRQARITQQKMTSRLGGKKLPSRAR